MKPRAYCLKYILSIAVVLAVNTTFIFNLHAQVKVKFIVINPDPDEVGVIPVKYHLPPEVRPEHVIDTGGLDVQYDVDNDKYYVAGNITLGPKETKVFTIHTKDVWKISKKKLDVMREHVEEKIEDLTKEGLSDTAKKMRDDILARIDAIQQEQEASIPIGERIENYRINKKKIVVIENDMLVLEGLAAGIDIKQNIVTIVVEAKNPYEEKFKLPMKYYLLPEIGENYILDPAGLKTGYDMARSQFYLKDDIELEAGETRKFEIKVKDVWRIKEVDIHAVKAETDKILEQLVDTEYERLGAYIGNEIYGLLNTIRETQNDDIPFKKRVANFKKNQQHLEDAKEYLERLRSFLLQFELARSGEEGIEQNTGGGKQETRFGGGKAEGKGGGIGQGLGSAIGKGRGDSTMQRGGGIRGIRGLKGIILVSRSIFKGWKPDVTSTWIIILSIIGFLGIFTVLFYVVWIVLSMRGQKRGKA